MLDLEYLRDIVEEIRKDNEDYQISYLSQLLNIFDMLFDEIEGLSKLIKKD